MKQLSLLTLAFTMALPQMSQAGGARHEARKERMDKNGDGRVGHKERKLAKVRFEHADKNDDGRIDPEEHKTLIIERGQRQDRIRDMRQNHRANWDERADRNGDGVVGERELELQKKIAEIKREKLDLNDDGKISNFEFMRGKKIKQEKKQEWRENLKERADTNGDGTLDESEIEVAKEKRELALEKMDKDGNGKVDMFERKLAKRKRMRRQEHAQEQNQGEEETTQVEETDSGISFLSDSELTVERADIVPLEINEIN